MAASTHQFAAQLRAKGHNVEVRAVDTSKPESIAALVKSAEQQFGGIDVVRYNAAAMRQTTLADQRVETFNGSTYSIWFLDCVRSSR